MADESVMQDNLGKVTLLTEEQIWGDDRGNGQLQVMKSYGTKTGMSDLAIVLGGYMAGSKTKTSDNQRAGFVWSASCHVYGSFHTVFYDGVRYSYLPCKRFFGARPALPSSVTSKIQPSEVRLTRNIGDVQVVEYGEYPQTIAPENVNKELEQALGAGKLQATGKKYTFDGEKYDAYDKPFNAKEYVEYQHNGKKYIRVEAQPIDHDSMLSNGKTPKPGEACWIEVQPIKWLVEPDKITINGKEIDNPNAGVWVARQALVSGVQFDRNQRYDGNFHNTTMSKFLNGPFWKEIQVGRSVDAHTNIEADTDTLRKELIEKIRAASPDELPKIKRAMNAAKRVGQDGGIGRGA